MVKSHRTLLAQATGFKGRTAGVVRPAVEAVLAAAMALGIGQAGWNALDSNAASAAGPDTADTGETAAPTALTGTPFAPLAVGADVIALGQLDTVRLAGVRTAADPNRSGAILSLGDGRQQAYLVGQEVLDGIRLTAVRRDGVVLSHSGGERRVSMPMTQATGLAAAPASLPSLAAPETVSAAAALGAEEQAWLAATLQQPVSDNGAVTGFRLASPAPAAVTAAGLAAGDVVVTVNGASAGDPLAAIAAVQGQSSVALGVRRSDGTTTTLRFDLGAASGVGAAP